MDFHPTSLIALLYQSDSTISSNEGCIVELMEFRIFPALTFLGSVFSIDAHEQMITERTFRVED